MPEVVTVVSNSQSSTPTQHHVLWEVPLNGGADIMRYQVSWREVSLPTVTLGPRRAHYGKTTVKPGGGRGKD